MRDAVIVALLLAFSIACGAVAYLKSAARQEPAPAACHCGEPASDAKRSRCCCEPGKCSCAGCGTNRAPEPKDCCEK